MNEHEDENENANKDASKDASDEREGRDWSRTMPPRFMRVAPGNISFISLANWDRRELGSREVVSRILGSCPSPNRCAGQAPTGKNARV